MMPLAVLLSVPSGVAGCLCLSPSAVDWSGIISYVTWYNNATSASTANATTIFSILTMTMIDPFMIWLFLSLLLMNMYAVFLLLAFNATR